MAGIIARAAKRQVHLGAPRIVHLSVFGRHLHVTSAVRQKSDVDDDLFSSALTDNAPAAESPSKTLRQTTGSQTERREVAFYKLVEYVTERTGRKRAVKAGQVRQSAWLRLLQLATTPEQLEIVSDLFPRWRDSGKEFGPIHAEAFVRRCEELKCPPLALKVFGDHSKYGLGLTSMFAARHLLHSLHYKYPLQDTMTAAALFGLYKHPPVSSDLVACSMLYAACLKHDTANSRTVAKALLPQLRRSLSDTWPVPAPTESKIRAQYEEKPKIWLVASLRRIERKLKANRQDAGWLARWTRQDAEPSSAASTHSLLS
ncbi:hypothetical protein BV22DRAFT_1132095 [Leucogyrophana mollusca]|uniref:Uncharacterized protein n=1 Tax=Leucogyrophana mollusca TaxID=85980 RepID=A0ACB8B7J4_9AGAM|nr:hypothetical protein BV22DRAFT_1132095 [Leucogyrophana mollusca]